MLNVLFTCVILFFILCLSLAPHLCLSLSPLHPLSQCVLTVIRGISSYSSLTYSVFLPPLVQFSFTFGCKVVLLSTLCTLLSERQTFLFNFFMCFTTEYTFQWVVNFLLVLCSFNSMHLFYHLPSDGFNVFFRELCSSTQLITCVECQVLLS